MWAYTVIFLLISTSGSALNAGDSCTKNDGTPGTCKVISTCATALLEVKQRKNPKICGFENKKIVVCCADAPKSAVRGSSRKSTTTTGAPVILTYNAECSKAKRTGQTAYDKCLDYQEQLVFPCRESPTPNGGMVRMDHCNKKPEGLVTGGEDAYFGEFPHMALLGYKGGSSVVWRCGGVLVSERYILTAGHCTSSRTNGPVTKVRIGILKRGEEVDPNKEYDVVDIIKHPEYKSPSKYNDIALLKTDRNMVLDRYAVPACLPVGGAEPLNNTAIVSGWGTTVFRANYLADVLQKTTLTRFEESECHEKLDSIRHLTRGYNHSTQMCYGDRQTNKDSCEGDSGGPLQIKHETVQCMYSVIGVISSGRWCGIAGEPGIYTRVSAYMPWIQSVVWP